MLLDLDSPVIHLQKNDSLPADGKSSEELATKPEGDCDVSESDPPSREEMSADGKRSAKSSTEKSSQGSGSLQESPNWPDFAGTILRLQRLHTDASAIILKCGFS